MPTLAFIYFRFIGQGRSQKLLIKTTKALVLFPHKYKLERKKKNTTWDLFRSSALKQKLGWLCQALCFNKKMHQILHQRDCAPLEGRESVISGRTTGKRPQGKVQPFSEVRLATRRGIPDRRKTLPCLGCPVTFLYKV